MPLQLNSTEWTVTDEQIMVWKEGTLKGIIPRISFQG
jgi:hypothetical protein